MVLDAGIEAQRPLDRCPGATKWPRVFNAVVCRGELAGERRGRSSDALGAIRLV